MVDSNIYTILNRLIQKATVICYKQLIYLQRHRKQAIIDVNI